MRQKIFILIFLIVLNLNIYAAFIPVSNIENKNIFYSPALLATIEREDIPFGVEVKDYADMDFINFISNPAEALSDASIYLKNYLLDKDDQYYSDNYEKIKEIFRFDPLFPSFHDNISENADYIKNYLNDDFENRIGIGNRARAVSNALSSDLNIYPTDSSSIIGGELDFSLSLYGGQVRKGFGWGINMGIVYDGVSSILSSPSYENYNYGSGFYFTLGGDLGYGTYIGENFAIGVSFSPDFIFQTVITNPSILSSRISGQIVELVASNAFDVGLSLKTNLGFMINAGDSAKILIDFRNLPAIQMYWYFNAMEVLSSFKMYEDDNIYFVPPDVSLGLVWDKGPCHVEGEISNIADQLIWKAMIPSYKFDILSVPKLSFAYRILDDMSIGLGYEFRSVVLSFMWSGLKAEFSTRVDKLGFGITLGYEF